ncbi:MAG: hypothetical protein ACFFD4_19305 [Candidatus Odinarchaeota archaeon]
MSKKNDITTLVDTWRSILKDGDKSWVMFEHGTCVIFVEPQMDLQARAREIMEDGGLVIPGTPAGDFRVMALKNHLGWLVVYHYPGIVNYVDPRELEDDELSDPVKQEFVIGFIGREKRHKDAESLNIVHVEDKRP